MDKNFIKSSIIVCIGNVINRMLGMVFFIILARMYTPEDYGFIRYVIAIATTSVAVASSGYPSALTRFLGKYGKNKEARYLYFSNTIVAVSILLFSTIFVLFIIGKLNIDIFLVIVGSTILAMYSGLVRGLHLYNRLAVFNITTNITKILLILLVFYITEYAHPFFILAIFAFSCLIPIVLLELVKSMQIKFKKSLISKITMKNLTKFAVPVIIMSLAYNIISSFDIIYIEYYIGTTDVGVYSVEKTLIQVFLFVPTAINIVLMPTVAGFEKKQKIVSYTKLSLILTALMSSGLLILLYFTGALLIETLFTSKYLGALNSLYVLSLGMAFFSIYSVIDTTWTGIGKPSLPTSIMVITAIINIITNIYFVPILGIFGAGIAF
ncbi:MAG: oligosaccharide flippase family protein [Methanosarcinales archaeon]